MYIHLFLNDLLSLKSKDGLMIFYFYTFELECLTTYHAESNWITTRRLIDFIASD